MHAPNPEVAVTVRDVYKTFILPHQKNASVKSALINLRRRGTGYERQEVLHNVSFEIKKGEFFGIVGRNGSGKSTMLKLLAGIYTPDSGEVKIHGKLTPFIELGVGFNPELTGRENVFLNGALLGFNRKEMLDMYDEIVEFAELERFMDQKLKNYSSGMQVRLAFSIAIRAQSDILLIDEVLAVGDANFQKKCFKIFDQIKASGRTVVFVTHDMGAVERYCDRALLLYDGEVQMISDAGSVAYQYARLNKLTTPTSPRPAGGAMAVPGIVDIAEVYNEVGGKKANKLKPADDVVVKIVCTAQQEAKNLSVGLIIYDQNAFPLYAINTHVREQPIKKLAAGQQVTATFTIQNIFSDGNYFVVPSVTSSDGTRLYDTRERGHMFTVKGWDFPAYVMQPRNEAHVEISS